MRRVSFNDRISRTSRNWRYHTELKMWLTKDLSLPEPVQLSVEKEQGSYVFFNQISWEKVRVRKPDRSPLPKTISPTATDWLTRIEQRYRTSSYSTSNSHPAYHVRMFNNGSFSAKALDGKVMVNAAGFPRSPCEWRLHSELRALLLET